jgi:hypothetical protein
MAQILERIFVAGGTTKLLSINNGEYVRELNMGNDWNAIRLGLLVAIPTNGTVQNRIVQWGWGLCSNMIGLSSATTPHWIGSYSTGSQLTYNANSGLPYYNFQPQFARKVVTTVTTANIGTIQFNMATADGTLQRKTPIMMDIARSFTIQNLTLTAGTALNPDYNMKDLLEAMEVPPGSTASAQGNNFGGSTSNTLVGDDSAGELNTLSIYWGSNLYPLEVYGMAVYRVR